MSKWLVLLIIGLSLMLGQSMLWAQDSMGPSTSMPSTAIHEDSSMPKRIHKGKGEHEHHPEIRMALHKLRAAKGNLEKAAHDYAGHRVKAIAAIDQAISELEQALRSDKK